jgi:MIP family channel proteins
MAEALGTFFLTFVGGSAICMDAYMKLPGVAPATGIVGFGLLGIALAHGLALMVAVYMAAGKSGGHINPAVTVGLWSIGKINASRMLTYVAMQLIGAVIGGLAIWGMFSMFKANSPFLGSLSYNDNPNTDFALSMAKAIGIEAVLTFLLMSVVLNTAVDAGRAAKQMFGICIGLTVTFGILIGGPYTGAAMNPARYFGTAVVSGQLSQLAVYFVGPIVGAIAAAFFYKFFLEEREPEKAEASS